jgi:hypothetical protein
MQIELPKDAQGFVRRECARCRRSFKTRSNRHDASAIQKVLLSALPHANFEEMCLPPPVGRCPYCGHRAQAEDWLYEVHRRALEELGVSLGQHVRFEQMQQIVTALWANPQPTYVPVAPPALEFDLPPESDEAFATMHFVCCGEDARLVLGEVDRHFCPRCGAESGPPPKTEGRIAPS